ncbi:MAG: DUF6090 family protein [Eudoraea sp.]|uniref:DUF6090 family protein n=2 Tax=Eudoraea sp. TaxID=1979955 RepID=UPI003C7067B5
MFKFFRKIRQNLLTENPPNGRAGKFGKYLLYAIGEIVLVVIGILFALQINNWNEFKKDRAVENKLLIELKENLNTNLVRLTDEIQKEHNSIAEINLIVEHIDNRRAYHDSLDTHFRQAILSHDIVLSSSAFEAIKSKGFEIIDSDSLRKDIIDLFDVSYSNLISETVRLEDLFWPSSVLPILHTHFRWEGNTTKPVDYEALLNDKRYTNMITNRRHFRKLAALKKSESLLRTKTLLAHIDSYLELAED